jgi:hypothetical protein
VGGVAGLEEPDPILSVVGGFNGQSSISASELLNFEVRDTDSIFA